MALERSSSRIESSQPLRISSVGPLSEAKRLHLAVLPWGTYELPSEHLPGGMNCMVTRRLSEELVRSCNADGHALVLLPALSFGLADSTAHGEVAISDAVCSQLVADIALQILMHGPSRLIIVSGHAPTVSARFAAATQGAEAVAIEVIPWRDFLADGPGPLGDYDHALPLLHGETMTESHLDSNSDRTILSYLVQQMRRRLEATSTGQ